MRNAILKIVPWTIPIGIAILSGFLIISATHKNQENSQPDKNIINKKPTPYIEELYASTPEERNSFLFFANSQKIPQGYEMTIKITDYGIENFRDIIWDDIDFWSHRGTALLVMKRCEEAIAAFYHIIMRDPENKIANAGITSCPSL